MYYKLQAVFFRRLLCIAVFIALTWTTSKASKDNSLKCGACHMLVDQMDWGIKQTDPKKTIQVGSFRINPDGTQKLNEIPYKRSGVQLSELIDEACSHAKEYFQVTDKSGRKLYRRQNRRDNKPTAISNVVISQESQKALKFACEGIAEDFEDEIVEAFKKEDDGDYFEDICVGITGLCTPEQLYDVEPDIADVKAPNEGDDGSNDEKKGDDEDDESTGNHSNAGDNDDMVEQVVESKSNTGHETPHTSNIDRNEL